MILDGDMYSLTVHKNPAALALIELVGLDFNFLVQECRLRDAYLSKDRTKVIVYTRLGGGNRDSYKQSIDRLRSKYNYVKDYDDTFDSTYASFEFKIDEDKLAKVVAFYASTDTRTGQEKTEESLKQIEQNPEKFMREHPEFKDAVSKIFGEIAKL